jgi:hypothetical protein
MNITRYFAFRHFIIWRLSTRFKVHFTSITELCPLHIHLHFLPKIWIRISPFIKSLTLSRKYPLRLISPLEVQLAANHPSLPDEHKIHLHLRTWANVLAEPIKTYGQQRARVDKILHFFIKVAALNQLATTPAVQSLHDCLDSLTHLGDCRIDIKGFDWKTRIAQLARPAKAEYANASDSRNLCIHGMPLFNIWDSLSFIYTVCTENIHMQVRAEFASRSVPSYYSSASSMQEYISSGSWTSYCRSNLDRGKQLEAPHDRTCHDLC